MSERDLETIRAALQAIADGATGDEMETQNLEFKEDPAVHQRNRNPDAALVEILADEVVGFSNADAGVGYIVVGVSDRLSGPKAFTGTDRQPEWFERKIFANTQPNINVEASELIFEEARLVVLRIPRGLTLYQRPKGQASRRVGTYGVPLTQAERQEITFARANPDFSGYPSTRAMAELDPIALDQARQLLAARRALSGSEEAVPNTTDELLHELALFNHSGKLTFAAEVLFMPPPRGRITARHLLREVPGGEPKATLIAAPLITAFLRLGPLIETNASQEIATVSLPSGQEVAVPAFPSRAVDEVVANAFAHRDWDAAGAVVVDQSPTELKVWSPGALPVGVHADNLLTTQSVPRNPTLMSALRMLGLAEESSRGFDRMWVSMLSTGRTPPSINATPNSVEVSLSSGRVDEGFIVALASLIDAYGPNLITSVNGLLITRHLMYNPILTTATASHLMQVSQNQATGILHYYESAGVVEQLRDAPEWVLSGEARNIMQLEDSSVRATVTVQEWVETQLREGAKLSARGVAQELGVEREMVTEILRHLRAIGRARIDPTGPQRGPGVQWIGV